MIITAYKGKKHEYGENRFINCIHLRKWQELAGQNPLNNQKNALIRVILKMIERKYFLNLTTKGSLEIP